MAEKVQQLIPYSDTRIPRHLLFVYGTLKREHGSPAHERYMKDCLFIGKCSIPGVMVHLGGCPGLVPDEVCRVTGEVYEVNELDIKEMDRYETVPINYQRKLVVTPFGTAWVYYKAHINLPLSPDHQCVDRGLWLGGKIDRMPYGKVLDYYLNKRWLEPDERKRPFQPMLAWDIPESSPARGPVVLIPPPKADPPAVKIKPVIVGPGVGVM